MAKEWKEWKEEMKLEAKKLEYTAKMVDMVMQSLNKPKPILNKEVKHAYKNTW